ncbi:GNAT family N-acetyltransferase [Parabacteroides bouchesdurhonensis]|uniref:GNAT family N-acetyltransferase n=1 Tax=Parabacteroides bouchesdurhonensis TaxID=1936995 RepID=UPI000C821394|nr:GNAT family N-acetyltransferase [Parabacteroides bouchesdurhonensis]
MDKKQQIIDLWHTCFDDSEAFISLYFDRVYNDNNTLTIEKNGQIVSTLQMLPYTMNFYGKEISVAYIYGACTAPEYRNQGLMRQLIEESFQKMKERTIALAVIVPADPWLFDFYREQGFTEAFDYTLEAYHRSNQVVQAPTLTVVPPEVPPLQQLYAYFDKKLRERSCCVLHTYDDFITILRDIQQSGDQMLTVLNIQQEPVGMIFLRKDKDRIFVKELLFDNDQVKELLLQEATLQNNVKEASYVCMPVPPGTMPYGMARVIDTDRLINYWIEKHPHSPILKNDLKEMDIQNLTRHLLNYPERKAYMSLMLD